MSKRYKKFIIGKIVRDEKGNESFVYFPTPIEESVYAKENNVDMSKLFVVRDLIVIYLTDDAGKYALAAQYSGAIRVSASTAGCS